MKRLLVLTICFMFIGVASGFAEPFSCAESLPKHTWELGTEISHITYKEPGVMKEKGMMYGVNFSYTYRGWLPPADSEVNNCMGKIEGRVSWGEVDYKNSGTLNDIEDYMLEFRGLVGYDFSVLRASTITPYMGIGYRYLNDDMSGRTTSTGAWGYEREITYGYIPMGIEMMTDLGSKWSIGATLEYDYFWDGTVKSHLGDVPGYYDIENDQDSGYGCRGSIKLQKKGNKINFVIESFVRYWNIKKSDYTTDPLGSTWYEPKNNSLEFGVKFAARF